MIEFHAKSLCIKITTDIFAEYLGFQQLLLYTYTGSAVNFHRQNVLFIVCCMYAVKFGVQRIHFLCYQTYAADSWNIFMKDF